MSGLPDQEARARIRESLDENLVVEAAAGTGKTSELTRRIVAVLERGRSTVDGVVAVTFTEKAAGELKLRLRSEIEEARRRAAEGSAARVNLDAALSRLEEARVSTIHGFCADLLRERPVEAGVDPRFTVLSEDEARRLFEVAFRRFLEDALERPPEGIRRFLRRTFRPKPNELDAGPSGRLLDAAYQLAGWRDHAAAWRRPEGFDREGELQALAEEVHQLAALTASPRRADDLLHVRTRRVRELSGELRRSAEARGQDPDGLESRLVALAGDWELKQDRRGGGEWYADGVRRAQVMEQRARLVASLAAFTEEANADLAAALHEELAGCVDRYEALKKRAGALDFLDLLLKTRDLLRGDARVRAAFSRRFPRLFVDEFQDTDPLQAEILLLLFDEDPAPGKLFLVGDPKQAIYRFRRADVATYREVTRYLVSRGAGFVNLTTSFRAVPAIQAFVNASFAPKLDGDAVSLQADHVPLAPHRDDHPRQPAIVALPVPRPYGPRGGVTESAIEASLPDAVGAFVAWLLHESGFTVTEREAPERRVPISARHVCLLFRRFESFEGDVTRPYVVALESRGVPHLLVGGRSFHAREEVETVRAALTALEWPDDELSVFATLRGPLFALSDEALLEWRREVRRFHPFRTPPADELSGPLGEVREALLLLKRLSEKRNDRPVSVTLARLLAETRAHAGFVLRPAGEQALANVLHVAELARAYEREGGLSFRGFVERLRKDAEERPAPEAPILEEASEGVRLMTVHKAKGLEFPVVVMADPTGKLAGRPSRFVDTPAGLAAQRLAGLAPLDLISSEPAEARRDEAEGVRVAYVAATRARDLLVVPAVGDGPEDKLARGWTSPLQPLLFPKAGLRRRAAPAPLCPDFGGDSVLDRPGDLAFDVEGVRPGLHENGVVWWDPSVLRLDVEAPGGLRREELLGNEEDALVAELDLAEHADWHVARDAALEAGTRPSRRVEIATTLSRERAEAGERSGASGDGDGDGEESYVPLIELPVDASRPGGRRFGTLVHAVLAAVPLDASPEAVREAAEAQARLLGCPRAEAEAAATAVVRALGHELLSRARAAESRGECRREAPVTLVENGAGGSGVLVEGVIDLAFREGGAWTVVDFKTDREVEAALAAYRIQVGLYARAVAAATGEPAEAILLRV